MKLTINNLMTQLHDTFGDDEPSPQVAQLMQEMERHVQHWQSPAPEDALLDTAEALAAELEVEHPAATGVVRKIIEALNNMGV